MIGDAALKIRQPLKKHLVILIYQCIRIKPTVIGEECNENISLEICTYVLQ
jgi:hypothetical protein